MQITSPAPALNYVPTQHMELTLPLAQDATTAALQIHMLYNQLEYVLVTAVLISLAILSPVDATIVH